MKIGIVTVYNSYNCGSFLQAYALYRTLSKKGNDVVFLKREPYRLGTLHYRICKALKALLKGHPISARFIMQEHFMYKKMQKMLPKTDTLKGLDLVVYGSDTIWNFDAAYFRDNWAKYWGKDVENRKITYAASAGSTDASMFIDNPECRKCINEFSGVAVRDEHTFDIAEKLLENKKPVMVVDPTMLLSVDDYADVSGKCSKKDFILVYYFGNMPENQKKMIHDFAKANNKNIYYFGNNMPFSVERMLAYFKAADYVVTNTFHGNVFSIIFNKKFVSFGKKQKKIEGLLNEFGLSHRHLNDNDDIDEVLPTEINYEEVNAVLREKRDYSSGYLEQFIKEKDGEI